MDEAQISIPQEPDQKAPIAGASGEVPKGRPRSGYARLRNRHHELIGVYERLQADHDELRALYEELRSAFDEIAHLNSQLAADLRQAKQRSPLGPLASMTMM